MIFQTQLLKGDAPEYLEIRLSLERIISIELFGEQFKFKADAEDTHAQKAVEYLQAKVNDVKGETPTGAQDIGKFAHLLLATLNICNDYFDLKDKHDAFLKAVHDRSSELVKKIDNTLA